MAFPVCSVCHLMQMPLLCLVISAHIAVRLMALIRVASSWSCLALVPLLFPVFPTITMVTCRMPVLLDSTGPYGAIERVRSLSGTEPSEPSVVHCCERWICYVQAKSRKAIDVKSVTRQAFYCYRQWVKQVGARFDQPRATAEVRLEGPFSRAARAHSSRVQCKVESLDCLNIT